jgi:hypothetical protein
VCTRLPTTWGGLRQLSTNACRNYGDTEKGKSNLSTATRRARRKAKAFNHGEHGEHGERQKQIFRFSPLFSVFSVLSVFSVVKKYFFIYKRTIFNHREHGERQKPVFALLLAVFAVVNSFFKVCRGAGFFGGSQFVGCFGVGGSDTVWRPDAPPGALRAGR